MIEVENDNSTGDASIITELSSLTLVATNRIDSPVDNRSGIKRGFLFRLDIPLINDEDMKFLHRIYEEAPNDVLEHILGFVSGRLGKAGGGFNIFRLVNRRIKCLVENSTTRVFWDSMEDISSFPASLFERTKRLRLVSCVSSSLNRLDGLPPSLLELQVAGKDVTSLEVLPQSCPLLTQFLIFCGTSLRDLSPLGQSRHLKHLFLINCVQVTDLSFLASLPQLQHLVLGFDHPDLHSNVCDEDLSYIGHCVNLEALGLSHHSRITNLSCIANCTKLESLSMTYCDSVSDISSLSHCLELTKLDISQSSVMDLSPLKDLKNLTKMTAYRMPDDFSVQIFRIVLD